MCTSRDLVVDSSRTINILGFAIDLKRGADVRRRRWSQNIVHVDKYSIVDGFFDILIFQLIVQDLKPVCSNYFKSRPSR